jgi:N-acetylated-alpha-linked acidic dipeptidase
MGSGSDFTAFQDFAGIPSLDMGFGTGEKSPVYHYHSNYDSFDWMARFGDPSFQYHTTIAKVWALVAANLVESPVIQLNATDYSLGLKSYIHSVKEKAIDAGLDKTLLFGVLDKAIERFQTVSEAHDTVAAVLAQKLIDDDIPWWKWWEKVKLYYAIRQVNTKYKLLERKFLYAQGLDDRSWFKHVVFAPGKWTGYAGATFPGIVEAIEDRNVSAATRWIHIAAALVVDAANHLEE